MSFTDFQSVGCSHSVRANVQSVLSLLKCHQPHLCNNRVLSNNPNSSEMVSRRHSDSSSSSSSSSNSGEELSELLQALQEELRLMSLWVHLHLSSIWSDLLQILQMVFNLFARARVCVLQRAGWADEAVGVQCVRTGKKRNSEGAREAASENGDERRADREAQQAQNTGGCWRMNNSVHTQSSRKRKNVFFLDSCSLHFPVSLLDKEAKKGSWCEAGQ